MSPDEYFQTFLKMKALPSGTPYGGIITFGEDKNMSDYFTNLILSGKKTACINTLESFNIDMIPLPKAGRYYTLTDFAENPCGIIMTVNVKIIDFKNITWKMAEKEGEDGSMEEWRENHICAFQDEAEIMGFSFTEDSPVVFEEFTLLYS